MLSFRFSTAMSLVGGGYAVYRTSEALGTPGSQSWSDLAIWWLMAAAFAGQAVVLWRRRRRVPSVTGRSYAEAKLVLEEAGLRMRFGHDVDDPSGTADEVMAQDPAAGRLAMRGSDVSVTLTRPKRRT